MSTESGEGRDRKPLVFLEGEIKSPPFTPAGREEAGTRLREIQEGESLGMPISRPMPSFGPRVHELRIRDEGHNWRVIYRIDADAILVVVVFAKSTRATRDESSTSASEGSRITMPETARGS
jgi:phage-related protein